MQGPNRQRGVSLYGWIFILGTLAVVLIVGMKSFPIYMNDLSIKNTLAWAGEQPELAKATPLSIRRAIQRRMDTGYISHIKTSDIKVVRVEGAGNKRAMKLDYEVRVPMMFNVDWVYKFSHYVELMQPRD